MGNLGKEIKMSIQAQEKYILDLARNVIGQARLWRHDYREHLQSIDRFAVAILLDIQMWLEDSCMTPMTAGKIVACGIGPNRPKRRGQILHTPWSSVEIWTEERRDLEGHQLQMRYVSFVITAAIFDIFRHEQTAYHTAKSLLYWEPIPGCDP
jgi:hypothetical protein